MCVYVSHSVMSDSFETPWIIACQAPLSLGLSRQEYWCGFPCPLPGDLPDPAIKPTSPSSPALQADFLPLRHQESPKYMYYTGIHYTSMSS